MPKVGSKHFPYTEKGMMMAKKEAKKMGKSMMNVKPKKKAKKK